MLRHALETIEFQAGLTLRLQVSQVTLASSCYSQRVHHGRLAGATPSDQSVEPRTELDPGSLIAPHEPGIVDLNGFHEVLGHRDRLRFVAASNRESRAVHQRQAQSFERRSLHLDPRVTRSWRLVSPKTVAVGAHHFAPVGLRVVIESRHRHRSINHLHGTNVRVCKKLSDRIGIEYRPTRLVVHHSQQSLVGFNVRRNRNRSSIQHGLHYLNRGLVRHAVAVSLGAAVVDGAQQGIHVRGGLVGSENSQKVKPGVNGNLDSREEMQLTERGRALALHRFISRLEFVHPGTAVVIGDRNTIDACVHETL